MFDHPDPTYGYLTRDLEDLRFGFECADVYRARVATALGVPPESLSKKTLSELHAASCDYLDQVTRRSEQVSNYDEAMIEPILIAVFGLGVLSAEPACSDADVLQQQFVAVVRRMFAMMTPQQRMNLLSHIEDEVMEATLDLAIAGRRQALRALRITLATPAALLSAKHLGHTDALRATLTRLATIAFDTGAIGVLNGEAVQELNAIGCSVHRDPVPGGTGMAVLTSPIYGELRFPVP